MQIEKLEQIIRLIAKGDTSSVELLFNKPGGRKYLESIVLIVISNLPYAQEEKVDIFVAFMNALNKIEKRIIHQKEGQKILNQVHF